MTNLTFSSLSGIQKTAIFLMAMGEKVTKDVFLQMNDDEIRDISLAMASLGVVDAHLVEQVLDEYMFLGYGGKILKQGSVDEARAESGLSLDAMFKEVFRCSQSC